MAAMPDSDAARLEREDHTYQRSFRVSKAQMGMTVFLASLSVLFGASLVAMVLTRIGGAPWPDAELTELPRGLIISTVLMGALSFVLHRAVSSVQRNRQRALLSSLNWAVALAVAFVLAQSLNWTEVASRDLGDQASTLFPFTFFFLTGLHASHVVGGLVPLLVIRGRARQQDYSSSRHEPVKLCAQYWHFLGVVWVVLGVALYLMG